jgi:hypothetical protein
MDFTKAFWTSFYWHRLQIRLEFPRLGKGTHPKKQLVELFFFSIDVLSLVPRSKVGTFTAFSAVFLRSFFGRRQSKTDRLCTLVWE